MWNEFGSFQFVGIPDTPPIVHCTGEFHRYDPLKSIWSPLDETTIGKEIGTLDGFEYLVDDKVKTIEKMIAEYRFSGKEPLRAMVFSALLGDKPKALKRKSIYERIVFGILNIVETFEDNTGDL